MSPSLPEVRGLSTRGISVLKMSFQDAKQFFLKGVSYSNIDFPKYFHFDNVLKSVDTFLSGKSLSDLRAKSVREMDDVNHTLFTNKDGKYAWRPLELIHPVLYVSLVNKITDSDNWHTIIARFSEFSANYKIKCLSLPVESHTAEKDKAEQISHWWHEVELQSIELAMDYSYLIQTDITDCYGSIYTHSIVWSLHGKYTAKTERLNKKLIGNQIDWHIQDMRYGQTNGIPQGSVLMDFIAEMLLGYADQQLTYRIKDTEIEDYQILRYRDDYRIFVNNPQDGELIVKELTGVLIDLGLTLNPSKTKLSNHVVKDSIKKDKLNWITRHKFEKTLLKQLLIIHDHATEHPNSGSLVVVLSDYQQRLEKCEGIKESLLPLISITVDIGYSNPKTYPIISAILSRLIDFIDDPLEKIKLINRVIKRFTNIPNTGYLEIWLQRFTIHIDRDISYNEPLCKLVHGDEPAIWNSDWISSNQLRDLVKASNIVDTESIPDMSTVITANEIELFFVKVSKQFSA